MLDCFSNMLDVLGVLVADSMMDLSESSYRSEILRCEFQNVLEFRACFLKSADFDQRTAERDVSGKI